LWYPPVVPTVPHGCASVKNWSNNRLFQANFGSGCRQKRNGEVYRTNAADYHAPFLLAKAFTAGTGLRFIAGLNRSSTKHAFELGGASACFMATQAVDSAMHFTDTALPVGTVLYQAMFFAGVS